MKKNSGQKKSLYRTQDCELSHSATALFHLAYINSIVVGGNVVYGEATEGAVLLHAIFSILLQSRFLHEPVGISGTKRHLTHECG